MLKITISIEDDNEVLIENERSYEDFTDATSRDWTDIIMGHLADAETYHVPVLCEMCKKENCSCDDDVMDSRD